ncbi:DUF6445 family protein [Novosphingobium sp.]|uniref:DUF6445 family protein n=1 Tax=Novosphingobium sp. TaxID=1874826 RepID=UPI0038B7B07B
MVRQTGLTGVHAVQALSLGREGVPLRWIDEAHPAPATLCAAAERLTFARSPDDLYPGLRAPVPPDYGAWLSTTLIAAANMGGARLIDARFAVVRDAPDRLVPIQRIPHFDDADPSIFAAVHYLCSPPHRGTAFYRHRATGFERIDGSRVPAWRQALMADARAIGLPPPVYPSGAGPAFELIGAAPLTFNRLVIYPANCLHAGEIGDSWQDDHPRLTITALFQCESALHNATGRVATGGPSRIG